MVNTNTAASDKKSAAEKGAIMEQGQEALELLTFDEQAATHSSEPNFEKFKIKTNETLIKPVGGPSVVAMEVEQKKRKVKIVKMLVKYLI